MRDRADRAGLAVLGLMAADADIWQALCQPLGAGGGLELALVFADVGGDDAGDDAADRWRR